MYFIRHSEKLGSVDKPAWKKMKRSKDNPDETPISKNGYKIADETMLQILDKDKRKIGHIYSSPSERCIQTALQFQKTILKERGIRVPIRIENGLIYWFYPNIFDVKKFEKRRMIMVARKETFIDNYMTPTRIAGRYGRDKFDLKYKSVISKNDINNAYNNWQKQIDQRLRAVFSIMSKSNQNKLNIACSHGEIIRDILVQFIEKVKLGKKMLEINSKYFRSDNYCFWLDIQFKNNKMKILKLRNNDGIQKVTKKTFS